MYYTSAARLQLIPASAKRAAGRKLEIRLDRSSQAAELVDVDVKVRVSHHVTALACQTGRECACPQLAQMPHADSAA